MSNIMSLEDEAKINGIKGIAQTIRDKAAHLPTEYCPLLRSEISEIKKLSDAVAVLTRGLT